MDAAYRPEFAPPPPPGQWRAYVLAVLAHLVLLLGLTQGLRWQRESSEIAIEAELWSALPRQAAPREVVTPPPPPAQPVVRAPPLPEPPVVKAPPPPPAQRDADIALEREKQKRELEERRQAELERERARQRRLEAQQKQREEELARRKREEEAAKKKQEQARLLAEAKRKEDERKRREQEAKEEREEKRRAELREETLRRMRAQAGTGAPSSEGAAAQSSGPSAGWGARVQARVRPNIVFSDNVTGNPETIVEVRLAPDGTIVSKRIKKKSGHPGWDDAVLRALDKTEVLPRDVDGRVPPGGDLVFRPKG